MAALSSIMECTAHENVRTAIRATNRWLADRGAEVAVTAGHFDVQRAAEPVEHVAKDLKPTAYSSKYPEDKPEEVSPNMRRQKQ